MEDNDLQALMARLELLINRVEQLKSQNGLLLAQENPGARNALNSLKKTKSPGKRSSP
jgi:cell division protein ZapB